MKSFRLYLREPTTPPQRLVTDIPPEEQAQLQESFKPVVQRYRWRQRICLILVMVAFGFVFCFFVNKAQESWVATGFFLCWMVVAGIALFSPQLRCPACQNIVEEGYGPFCPECGAQTLQPGTWLRAPHCAACDRVMLHGKTRRYKVRACTHCGLWLDDAGV